MKIEFAVNYAKKPNHTFAWDLLYDVAENDGFDFDEKVELYVMAGLPDNAAEFMAEWYPELLPYALDNLRYTYGFDRGVYHWNENTLRSYLAELGETEESYQKYMGIIIRDMAFDGIILVEQ